MAISNGCFAIMMASEHPVLATFGGLVSIATTANFSILYERAFFVAVLMKRANLHLRLHRLHIFFNLFNITSALSVYAFKLLCMIMAISNGCFAIMMASEHPVLATFGGLVSIATTANFSILYERAFFVAVLMKRANLHLRQAINGASDIDWPTKRYMRKRIESVPPLGIKIGNFGKFERESTPIFLDFVVRNIAGLLLSLQFSWISGGVLEWCLDGALCGE